MHEFHYVTPPLTDAETEALKGTYLDHAHFDPPAIGRDIREDTTVYREGGDPVFVYLRRPKDGKIGRMMGEVLPALRQAVSWSNKRQAPSGLIGFLDPTPTEPFCRPSAFTRDYPELWDSMLPLFGALDDVFRDTLEAHHARQMAFVKQTCLDFRIPGTSFSTGTVNQAKAGQPCRFKAHRDGNNLASGFGVMAVWRRGSFPGAELIFPQWRTAVDLGCGDVILFDGNELHGNAPFELEGDRERISLVLYYRKGILWCGTPAEELEKARRRIK
jgi:hypothetical protein